MINKDTFMEKFLLIQIQIQINFIGPFGNSVIGIT